MSRYLAHRWLRPVLLIVVPCLAVALAGFVWLMGGRYVATENAYVKADIAQISSEIAGRIVEVKVRDHDTVRAGDTLIRLDPEPFTVAVAQAQAELDASRTEVATLLASWNEARSELQEADSKSTYWEAQVIRQAQLAGRGIVSSTKLEEVEINAIAARDRVAVMRQKVSRVAAQLGGQPERPVDDHPLVREKRAALDRAMLDLSRTTIRASLSGTAVNVKLQPGEQIRMATPLFALVSDARPWVEANFKETELTHVRPGHRATVSLDIYPGIEWSAEIESISPATGAEFAVLPPQNASGNWVKVVQRLPVRVRLLPRPDEPPLRAGMTARVSVDTERQRRLSHLFGGWSAPATAQQ